MYVLKTLFMDGLKLTLTNLIFVHTRKHCYTVVKFLEFQYFLHFLVSSLPLKIMVRVSPCRSKE